jgi:hypothetical protein
LYVRPGSVVPMGPEIQYASERSDTIELRCYPGANGSFTMYEDEGDNYNYETGKYSTIPITYTDNPRNVVIGARTGTFNGMDQKKVFNVVYVADNRGAGEPVSTVRDCQLIYTGAQVSCITGALQAQYLDAMKKQINFSKRVIGNTIALPADFAGESKNITIYDCSGRLLQKTVVKKNALDLRKDFGLAPGAYIVKARVVR